MHWPHLALIGPPALPKSIQWPGKNNLGGKGNAGVAGAILNTPTPSVMLKLHTPFQ